MIEFIDFNDMKKWLEIHKRAALRTYFPYGKYICADGREVLFNRGYTPIFERKNGVVKKADRNEWVEHIKQEWFYDDLTSPYPPISNRKSLLLCVKILNEWGVHDLDGGRNL